LAKEQCQSFDDLLTENAIERLKNPNTYSFDLPDFADGARLYVFDGVSNVPSWLSRLKAAFEIETEVRTSSASGLLVFQTENRFFATTFSSGWMQLKERQLEADFGLRVAINGLDDTKLKRLERANLGDALRGVHLSPFQRDLNSFGLDEALDLIRKVSGTANDDAAADTMSGAQSLKVTGDFTIADLPEIASDGLVRFTSDDYQHTSFRILDLVRPISDKDVIDRLDQLVVDNIINDRGSFELGLPITYDDQVIEYRIKGTGGRRTYPDLMLSHYVSLLGERVANLTPDILKQHKVVARFNENEDTERPWSIRTALIGSVEHENSIYAINEGAWYSVDDNFRRGVLSAFDGAVSDWTAIPQPRPFIQRAVDNHRQRYEPEGEYNVAVAGDLDLVCLDADLVTVPEVANSGFEICDLLDIENKRLIHVKKNSRRSSVLSHFIKQGSNSAQNIRWYPDVMNQLVNKVANKASQAASERLLEVHADENRKWTVEYWLADTRRADGSFEIPFFSKVTFRDELKKMRAMNYEVVMRFIEQRHPLGR
tara:strand:- start:185 stop:1810 length:1626 start_codon:yes stop_codon:yes gene_type:complete